MTLTPERVHRTHRIEEQGHHVSDPTCIHCGQGVRDTPDRLREPCPAAPLTDHVVGTTG